MDNAYISAMLTQLVQILGNETGKAIKSQIDTLIGVSNVNIQEIQSKITALQSVLDADPSTPEYDAAQNIITQLSGIFSRLASAELTINTLKGSSSVVGSVDYKVAIETARAQAAEAVNAACCAANAQSLADALVASDAANAGLVARVAALEAAVIVNASAITTEQSRATQVELALQSAIDAINNGLSSQESDIDSIQSIINASLVSIGLGANGSLTPIDPAYDSTNILEYIHDLSSEGSSRADDLLSMIKRLAKKAKAADEALDARLDTLESDATVTGSVAKTVADAVAVEAAARVADDNALDAAIDAEVIRATGAEATLQAQIDSLSGGGTGSIDTVRRELDATQVGAGLADDGSYVAPTSGVLVGSTSLKDADNKLAAEVANINSTKANIADVVLKSHITTLDVCAIGQAFASALNCAISGGTDCAPTCTPPDGAPSGDGAVL